MSTDKNTYMLKVYSCKECIPNFITRFRLAFDFKSKLLSKIIRIDEYYAVIFYDTVKTKIYKCMLPNINGDMSDVYRNEPACEFDFVLELPCHYPTLLKNKLKTIVLFS